MNLVINKRTIRIVFFQILLLIVLFSITTEAYAATASIFTPKCTSESCPFTFLAPIDFFSSGGATDVAKDGATAYLKGLYKFGIAIAAALAVLMITLGGVQYSTTDAIQGKGEGKEKIKSALIGLLLALLSYTILNTINPYLVAGDFEPQEIKVGNTVGSNTGSPAVTPVTNGPIGNPVGGAKGKFTNQDWANAARRYIEASGLNNLSPRDAADFFPNGQPSTEGWLRLFEEIIERESDFNTNTVFLEPVHGYNSVGLLQLSAVDTAAKSRGYSEEDLKDPYKNLEVGISIMKTEVQKAGCIACGSTGGAAYWSTLRNAKRAEIVNALK